METAPPAAIETERALLGALLLDDAQMLAAVDVLPPGAGRWFYHEAHQLVWDACLTLFETVADVLHRRGHLEKVGGSVFLAELLEAAVTTANVAHHARIVKDKALLRAVINIGQELTAGAFEQAALPDIIAEAEAALLHVASAQAVPAFTGIDAVMTRAIHDADRTDGHDLQGLPSGFHDLDGLTTGFQPTDLIVLAARPGMGKTSLGLQFAVAAARQPNALPVAVFSLEMSKQQLSMRMVCAEARVDSSRVRRGFVSGQEWTQLMEGAARLYELPILVDDAPNVSVFEIRARLRRVQMHGGLGLVVIDYLQLIAPARRKDSRNQEVSDISRDLKILAKELGVPVIALSQLSRDVEKRNNKLPVLSDLRDSGAIEQDADVVMLIYRGDMYEGEDIDPSTKLIVAKHRNGPTGEVRLAFHATYARFDPLANDHAHALAAQGA